MPRFITKLIASVFLLGLAAGCPAPNQDQKEVPARRMSARPIPARPMPARPMPAASSPGFQCRGELHDVAGRAVCAYRMEAKWRLAQTTCALSGGELISITDQAASEALFAAMGTPGRMGPQSLWIGATDVADEGEWRWAGGQRVEGVRWAHRQPDNAGKREHCGEWRSGDQTFNDLPCEVKRYYLCEPRPDSQLRCLGQTIEVGDRRFCFHAKGVTWPKAADACESTGGRLATIDSDAVSAGVAAHFDAANWWLGLNDREKEGQWRWDDGEVPGYGAWANNEPNDPNGTENCVFWRSTDGRWLDVHCRGGHPFICQAK